MYSKLLFGNLCNFYLLLLVLFLLRNFSSQTPSVEHFNSPTVVLWSVQLSKGRRGVWTRRGAPSSRVFRGGGAECETDVARGLRRRLRGPHSFGSPTGERAPRESTSCRTKRYVCYPNSNLLFAKYIVGIEPDCFLLLFRVSDAIQYIEYYLFFNNKNIIDPTQTLRSLRILYLR